MPYSQHCCGASSEALTIVPKHFAAAKCQLSLSQISALTTFIGTLSEENCFKHDNEQHKDDHDKEEHNAENRAALLLCLLCCN